jgi:predicted nucleic acid-binding Zn ribbon protein
MPIYEYRRPDGTTFDMQQSFSDEPLTVDPDTGVPVERVLHPPAVHFKGKGFYNTDYGTRNRQRETAAAAEGSSSGDSAKDSSAKDSSAKDSSAKDSSSSSDSSSGSSGGDSATAGKGEKTLSSSANTKAKPATSKTG